MRKVLTILFFAAIIGLIAYVLIQNPGMFQKVYLWFIGLFGLLTWPFRKMWSWLNGNDALKEIEQNNQVLKQELAQIKKDLAEAQKKLTEERRRNKLRMEALESKIRKEDQAGKAILKELELIKAQTPEEFKAALPAQERKQIQKDIWKEVDFGL